MSNNPFGKGEKNPRWNNGRYIAKDSGYVFIKRPDHPNADRRGYVREHALVMSEFLKRPIADHEVVHHKNENKQDNRIENLELMTRPEHTSHHTKGNVKAVVIANLKPMTSEWGKRIWATSRAHEKRKPYTCAGCGSLFESKQQSPRYCSHQCYVKNKKPDPEPFNSICERCGEPITRKARGRRYCSRACYSADR